MDPTTTTTTSSPRPTPAELQTAFEHSIWYLLDLWSAMRVALANNWGGPASSDKRDHLAAEISTLWARDPETDAEDVAFVLLDYMGSEFECEVEDGSEGDVAREILGVRERLLVSGDLAVKREVEARWRNRGQMRGSVQVREVNQDAEEGAVVEGEEEDSEEEEDEDGDVDMDAPPLVPVVPRERPAPIVDEDGFTKVVGKKRR